MPYPSGIIQFAEKKETSLVTIIEQYGNSDVFEKAVATKKVFHPIKKTLQITTDLKRIKMNNKLLFDFIVNKEDNTIQIKREFNAKLELVWQTWTTAELLDQWWGPKPWKAETKILDFREGGMWLYAMVSPEGEKHWSKSNFISITKEKYFSLRGGFSDENGTINPVLPQNLWETTFIPIDDSILVDILLTYDNLSDLEKELEMGFKEGMTVDFQQLDELLQVIK